MPQEQTKTRKLTITIEIDEASVYVLPIVAVPELSTQLSDTIRTKIAYAVSLHRDELLK